MDASQGMKRWYDFLKSRSKTTKTFTLNDIMIWEKEVHNDSTTD
jgi:hypothetical protein